jgi:hypothetical protein
MGLGLAGCPNQVFSLMLDRGSTPRPCRPTSAGDPLQKQIQEQVNTWPPQLRKGKRKKSVKYDEKSVKYNHPELFRS